MNRDNLAKLANYLAELPEGYEHFDMSSFAVDQNFNDADLDFRNVLRISEAGCGTVACALGHGPAAGIDVPDDLRSLTDVPTIEDQTERRCVVNWSGYSRLCFDIPTGTRVWEYLFGGDWAFIDNTPQGAARRIQYVLDHSGPPADFDPDTPSKWSMPS